MNRRLNKKENDFGKEFFLSTKIRDPIPIKKSKEIGSGLELLVCGG
jgi:hypothetical protein